jgi:hypothetical protein
VHNTGFGSSWAHGLKHFGPLAGWAADPLQKQYANRPHLSSEEMSPQTFAGGLLCAGLLPWSYAGLRALASR